MTEPTELLPCPFCGAAAHFEMDEGRWEWVECESCGMQGNRSASLMEDCKPKLVEAWNRRTPAPAVVEPVAWRVRRLDSPNYWIIFLHKPVDALMDPKREVQPLYTAPQPTQAQAGAVPLTDEQIDALDLPPSGTATVRDLVRIIESAHGIKQGDNHG